MHLPDGILDAKTALLATGAAAAGVGMALRQVKRSSHPRQMPMLGLAAAFVFAAQMLNFPVAGGTSGHLFGGVLTAILLGPSAAVLVMTCVLIVQCLMFADGGLLALGANVFNMGIVSVCGGYFVFSLAKRSDPQGRKAFDRFRGGLCRLVWHRAGRDFLRRPTRPRRDRPLVDRVSGHGQRPHAHRDRRRPGHRSRRPGHLANPAANWSRVPGQGGHVAPLDWSVMAFCWRGAGGLCRAVRLSLAGRTRGRRRKPWISRQRRQPPPIDSPLADYQLPWIGSRHRLPQPSPVWSAPSWSLSPPTPWQECWCQPWARPRKMQPQAQ